MTATTFGTGSLPPASLLPGEVADRISAHGQARDRVAKAQAELGSARRVGLPQARQRDIEAAADAVERNKPAPKPVHEAKAVAKIASLERDVAAAELVERRSRTDERGDREARQRDRARGSEAAERRPREVPRRDR